MIDIQHLVEGKDTTNLDMCPTITHLLSNEHPKVAKDKKKELDCSSRIVTPYVYEEVN